MDFVDLHQQRFKKEDESFHDSVSQMLDMDIDKMDFIHHFPVFTGHVNLARYLCLYECYKKVSHINGHYADIGTWKGSSFLMIAKLMKLFEPHSYAQIHAFDWFQGMEKDVSGEGDKNYCTSYERLKKLVEIQDLDNIARIHKIDLTSELPKFFEPENGDSHVKYKYVFVDCGITEVLEPVMEHFWPRLAKGGIMIFDHYGMTGNPDENPVIDKYITEHEIQTMTFARQPTAFVIK
jgi:hypothetical protein